MKRFLATAMLCFCSLYQAEAQTVNQLFRSMEKRASATKVKLNKTIITLASVFTDTYGVDRVEVLNFEDCNQTTIDNFKDALKTLKDSDFETLLSVNEKDEKIRILVKIEEEYIKELTIFSVDSEISMVRIYGEINPSEVSGICEQHAK